MKSSVWQDTGILPLSLFLNGNKIVHWQQINMAATSESAACSLDSPSRCLQIAPPPRRCCCPVRLVVKKSDWSALNVNDRQFIQSNILLFVFIIYNLPQMVM